jgi:Ice-binding-like
VADLNIETPNFLFQMIGDGARFVDMTRAVPVAGPAVSARGAQEIEPKDYNTMLMIIDALLKSAAGAAAAQTSILRSAAGFAVLATSTITNTGNTTVFGDIGLQPPGVSITGFSTASSTVVNGPTSTGLVNGPGLDTGVIHIADAIAAQAQSDASAAYRALNALVTTTDLSGQDLGGKTLTPAAGGAPGVFNYSGAAVLTGTLTIDFQNTPNAIVIIRTGTTLTTAAGAAVNVVNAGPTNGLYWLIGSSATFGAAAAQAGNYIAVTSITFGTGASLVSGRAIALGAAVTLAGNAVSRDAASQAWGTGRADAGSFGFSGGLASAVGVTGAPGPVGAGTIAATGTTAANSTPVIHQIEVVSAADGTKGVTLPTAVPGATINLYNQSGAVLKVWPKGAGEIINSLAAGTNIAMAANTSAVYSCGVSGSWFTIPVVPS